MESCARFPELLPERSEDSDTSLCLAKAAISSFVLLGLRPLDWSFQDYSCVNSYGLIGIGEYGVKVEFLNLRVLLDELGHLDY